MGIGVVVFPGSNCDRDMQWATEGCLGLPTRRLWHEETDLSGLDAVVLPGGFSYGDYLRCGAIARFAPVLQSLVDFAAKGGRVLGICNGFQVLTELGLLPGALTRNRDLHFICEDATLQVASARTPWMSRYGSAGQLTLPIAHVLPVTGSHCHQPRNCLLGNKHRAWISNWEIGKAIWVLD